MGLDKGLKCTVTEQTPQTKPGEKLTTSWVVFDADGNVQRIGSASMLDFTVNELFKEATHVVVTNKYERETGGFKIQKNAYADDEDMIGKPLLDNEPVIDE
ncbi:LPxTG domain-containing protein [Corynebacterium kutscheri]|nr:LPxTG domain-containing protein [Corynebacterium kutscheri]